MGTDRTGIPAHPRFQYVVVAQGPGLTGEFALVTGSHTCVARDPVHGPWEALEEVGAVVVGSTLLFTEGQCCKGNRHSQGLAPYPPPALYLAPQIPQLTPLCLGEGRS